LIHLRLSDADRERLGCVEWLDIDLYSVTVEEATILQDGFTIGEKKVSYDHPGQWRAALTPGPDSPPRFPALKVLVWMALNRAGVSTSLNELTFNVDLLAYKGDPADSEPDVDPEASPGKDAEQPASLDNSEPLPASEH